MFVKVSEGNITSNFTIEHLVNFHRTHGIPFQKKEIFIGTVMIAENLTE